MIFVILDCNAGLSPTVPAECPLHHGSLLERDGEHWERDLHWEDNSRVDIAKSATVSTFCHRRPLNATPVAFRATASNPVFDSRCIFVCVLWVCCIPCSTFAFWWCRQEETQQALRKKVKEKCQLKKKKADLALKAHARPIHWILRVTSPISCSSRGGHKINTVAGTVSC